jgi:hypothetical protein
MDDTRQYVGRFGVRQLSKDRVRGENDDFWWTVSDDIPELLSMCC